MRDREDGPTRFKEQCAQPQPGIEKPGIDFDRPFKRNNRLFDPVEHHVDFAKLIVKAYVAGIDGHGLERGCQRVLHPAQVGMGDAQAEPGFGIGRIGADIVGEHFDGAKVGFPVFGLGMQTSRQPSGQHRNRNPLQQVRED